MSRFKTFELFHFQRDSVMLRILPQVPWGLCFLFVSCRNLRGAVFVTRHRHLLTLATHAIRRHSSKRQMFETL